MPARNECLPHVLAQGRWLLVVAVIAAAWMGPARAANRPDSLEGSGDGHRRYEEGRLWQRRHTIAQGEAAALRSPNDVPVLRDLAGAYLDAGFFHRAEQTYERVLKLNPDDPEAHFGLGRLRQREWLAQPDPAAADEALQHFERAVRAEPGFWEAWVALAVLRFERRDPAGARTAALGALAARPDRAEVQLANAYLAYRNGLVPLSDSLFTLAIPRLPPGIAARFDDLSPLLAPAEAERFADLGRRERSNYRARFWSTNDPDPTTPENEARLEFQSRLAHAMLLLGDPWSPRWDARTDLYARYGRKVQIEDPSDTHHDEMPRVPWGEEPVKPTPQALAKLGQNEVQDGAAIFAPLPPGTRELPIATLISRFESSNGTRLLAQVETDGAPADSLAADCVVLDSLRHPVARESHELTPSACDPASRRAGDFAFDLQPGHYQVAFAVHDRRNGRGVARSDQEILPGSARLAISDVVLQCGPADLAASRGSIRLNSNLRARVAGGEPLFAYFEIYHLHTDTDGGNRFEYEYSIRSLGAEGRATRRQRRAAAEAASRLAYRSTQAGVGALRRQFVDIPTGSLPPSRYRLTIVVHDTLAGSATERSVDFVKE